MATGKFLTNADPDVQTGPDLLVHAFTGEDKPMLEAVQARMGDADF